MVRISNLMIIEALKKNARISYVELARRFGVTETAVRKRIRKLEEEGVIRGYTIDIDPRKLGMEVTATIGIDTTPERYIHVIDELRKMEDVRAIRRSTGDHMIMIDVWFTSSGELTEFVKMIEKLPGVTKTCPAIITDCIK
ncbi:MAG: Lrp/AsnC family transcriptional regulator [Candidatus Aenigmarchaeota archaeon]|nr:Lrp/AsnC family transcriptional regulator [Candidatus Aenigmarchaeota archaeon]